MAVFAFLPMLGFGIFMNIIVLYSRRLRIRIGMPTFTGVNRIPARLTGRFGYNIGIFMRVSVFQPRDGFFFCKTADLTVKFHHAVCLFCCLFRNFAFTKRMQLGIQSVIASFAADCPVFILVMCEFA